jgi:hypothetical protein
MYVTASDVYATAGIDSSVISEADINNLILDAEVELDRFTNATYWKVEETGTAASGTADTITKTDKFKGDNYIGDYVWVYSGTGSGQIREIESMTDDTLTVDRDWTTNPSSDSLFRIIHTATPAYISTSDGLYDGDDTDVFFMPKYPLVLLESLTIDGTSVTPSSVYQYKKQGKLQLNSDCEVSYFYKKKAQKNVMSYWWGVYPMPRLAQRFVTVLAALMAQAAQAGGTYNVPSTYSLPEGSLTIGQAYVNIRGASDLLVQELKRIEQRLIRYTSVFA